MRKLILGYCAGFISGVGAYIAYTKYKERKKQIDEENMRLFNEINSDIKNLQKRRKEHLDELQKEYEDDIQTSYPPIINKEKFDEYIKENTEKFRDILKAYDLKEGKIEEIKKGVEDEIMVDFPQYMSESQINYILSNVAPLSISVEYKNALCKLFFTEYDRKSFEDEDVILFDSCLEDKYSYLGTDIQSSISVGDILLYYAEQFEFDIDVDRTTYFGEVLNNIYEGNINSYLNDNYVLKICDEIISLKRIIFPIEAEPVSIKHSYDTFIYERVNNI
jgi:hypothetical protein|nr:MAG TPA: SMODS and SLOG-associating 2TM effector domain family 4 [Caudoviricetes sp.]